MPTFDPTISFTCPFCEIHVLIDENNESVAHTTPACEKFLQNNVVDYMIAVNDEIARQGGKTDELAQLRAADDKEHESE